MFIVNTVEYNLIFITFIFLKCSQKYKKLIKLAFLKRNHRKDKSNFQNTIVFLRKNDKNDLI